jgi:hypothetical protein
MKTLILCIVAIALCGCSDGLVMDSGPAYSNDYASGVIITGGYGGDHHHGYDHRHNEFHGQQGHVNMHAHPQGHAQGHSNNHK